MKYSKEANGMIKAIVVVGIVGIIISVIYYRSLEFLPFLWGVLIGCAVSIYKVILLDKAVNKALSMESKQAGNYVTLQQLLRLGLSAIALVLGATVPQISLWGVVLGILAFQIAIYRVGPGKSGKQNNV